MRIGNVTLFLILILDSYRDATIKTMNKRNKITQVPHAVMPYVMSTLRGKIQHMVVIMTSGLVFRQRCDHKWYVKLKNKLIKLY